jgi:hypothetical protein
MFGFMGACTGGLLLRVALVTADSAAAADNFLASIEAGEIHDSYMATASRFREEQDEATFAKFMEGMDLRDYSLESWRDRRLERGDQTQYRGTLYQRSEYGDPMNLPFKLDMVKEAGEWRVISFTGPWRTLIGPGAWFSQIPNDADLGGMTRDTLLAFDRAVKAGDFTEFYDSTSIAFKISAALSELQSTYQHFIDNEIDISGVANLEPVFDKLPYIRRSPVSGDVLVASGYFPTEPAPVQFVLRYHYEHPNWLLHRFLVELADG